MSNFGEANLCIGDVKDIGLGTEKTGQYLKEKQQSMEMMNSAFTVQYFLTLLQMRAFVAVLTLVVVVQSRQIPTSLQDDLESFLMGKAKRGKPSGICVIQRQSSLKGKTKLPFLPIVYVALSSGQFSALLALWLPLSSVHVLFSLICNHHSIHHYCCNCRHHDHCHCCHHCNVTRLLSSTVS